MGNEKNNGQRADGLMMVRYFTRQKASGELGEPLIGEDASLLLSEKIGKVMANSGITLEEARTAANFANGKHLGEVLRAIDIIEERQKEAGRK